MKKQIKNMQVTVQGITRVYDIANRENITCIITNDHRGKTLSICNNDFGFTIPFEPKRYLK